MVSWIIYEGKVQTIMSQSQRSQGANVPRNVGSVKLNVFEQSQDNKSIENLSCPGDWEDEEFLEY